MGRALRVGLVAAGVAALGILTGGAFAQAPAQAPASGAWMSATPTNDAPNPFQTIEGWAKLPAGREWGSTSAVDIDKDGQSIWVGERCGKSAEGRAANRCVNAAGEVSPLDPILKFDPSGKLVTSFGA